MPRESRYSGLRGISSFEALAEAGLSDLDRYFQTLYNKINRIEQ